MQTQGETRGRGTIALSLLLIGFATDQVTSNLPGIGIGLVAAAGVLTLVWVCHPHRSGSLLILAALGFTALIAYRANPIIEALDLLAALGLAVLGASYAQEGSPLFGTIRAWIKRGFGVFTALPAGLRWFVPGRMEHRATQRLGRMLRTAIVAGTLILIFGSLLASADAIFARIVTTPLHLDVSWANGPRHMLGSLIAALAAGVLVAYASRARAFEEDTRPTVGFSLGTAEWVVILSCVCALFALFVAIQFAYLFGGNSTVLSVPGLTYAEYARSGFGKMIAAAALTFPLIGVAGISWTRETASARTAYTWLSMGLLGLNLVVMASAFKRLGLYESAYGWTEARLFAHAIILWLAAFICCALVALATRNLRWLAMAAVGLALSALVGLNAMNVDGFIARRDLDRYATTGKIDAWYLAGLSGDATPTLAAALPGLKKRGRAIIAPQLACRAGEPLSAPWFSWNLGRARAHDAAVAAGITPKADPGGCGVSF